MLDYRGFEVYKESVESCKPGHYAAIHTMHTLGVTKVTYTAT